MDTAGKSIFGTHVELNRNLWGETLFLISVMGLPNITYVWYVAGCTIGTAGKYDISVRSP